MAKCKPNEKWITADLTMGAVESKFADIIWQNEAISSAGLQAKPTIAGLEEEHIFYCAEEELEYLRRLVAEYEEE